MKLLLISNRKKEGEDVSLKVRRKERKEGQKMEGREAEAVSP